MEQFALSMNTPIDGFFEETDHGRGKVTEIDASLSRVAGSAQVGRSAATYCRVETADQSPTLQLATRKVEADGRFSTTRD